MIARAALVLGLFLLLTTGMALAVEPSEMLKDPALEARARAISQEIRCLCRILQATLRAIRRQVHDRSSQRIASASSEEAIR